MSVITHKDGFKLELIALEEVVSVADHFDGDNFDVVQKVDDGELMWFCAHVVASKADVLLGYAYLGCCLYASLEDFVQDSGYYESMCDEAIADAKNTLNKLGV